MPTKINDSTIDNEMTIFYYVEY